MNILTNEKQYSAPQIVEYAISTETVLCLSYADEGEAGLTPIMGDDFSF